MGEAAEGKASKGRRGGSDTSATVPKARKSPGNRGPKKIEVKLLLSPEVRKRLGVHCQLTEESMGDYADRVLGEKLRAFGKGKSLFALGGNLVDDDQADDEIAA